MSTAPTAVRPSFVSPNAPQGVAPPHMPPPQPGSRVSGPRSWSPVLVGALAGPVALGAGVALQIASSGLGGDTLLRPLRMLTVPLLGGAGLTGGSPLLGLLMNIVLGVALGAAFGAVVSRLSSPRTVLAAALVLGIGVFAVDQLLLAPILSDVLALRDPVVTLAARLVFGAVLAIPFLKAAPATRRA